MVVGCYFALCDFHDFLADFSGRAFFPGSVVHNAHPANADALAEVCKGHTVFGEVIS
jgi:hypothetical protein